MIIKEFLSSLFWILSWLFFVIGIYLVFWLIIMPSYMFWYLICSIVLGVLCRKLSKRLVVSK